MPLYGIMSAARALSFYAQKSNVLQNNLANQATDGFKFDRIMAAIDRAAGAPVLNRSIDMKQGLFERTENPLHLALEGPGFFVVQTPAGERLTRNGAFRLDRDNVLVDSAMRPVLGVDGPLKLEGDTIDIDASGAITVDGSPIGRLRLVTVPEPQRLEKEGISLFVPGGQMNPVEAETELRQFGLETSNVDALSGIGEMITIQRNFALNTNALRSMDEMLATVTSNVGRVS